MDYLVAVLLPQLLHGLVFGAALGLLALGLTVIFGLLGVMNFAHGELYMLGAYAGIALIGLTQSFWIAMLIAPLLVVGHEFAFGRQLADTVGGPDRDRGIRAGGRPHHRLQAA